MNKFNQFGFAQINSARLFFKKYLSGDENSPPVALRLLVASPTLSASPDITETKRKRIIEEASCCVASLKRELYCKFACVLQTPIPK